MTEREPHSVRQPRSINLVCSACWNAFRQTPSEWGARDWCTKRDGCCNSDSDRSPMGRYWKWAGNESVAPWHRYATSQIKTYKKFKVRQEDKLFAWVTPCDIFKPQAAITLMIRPKATQCNCGRSPFDICIFAMSIYLLTEYWIE